MPDLPSNLGPGHKLPKSNKKASIAAIKLVGINKLGQIIDAANPDVCPMFEVWFNYSTIDSLFVPMWCIITDGDKYWVREARLLSDIKKNIPARISITQRVSLEPGRAELAIEIAKLMENL